MPTFVERQEDSANSERCVSPQTQPHSDEDGSAKDASSSTSTRSEQLERIEAMSVTLPVQTSTRVPPSECQ